MLSVVYCGHRFLICWGCAQNIGRKPNCGRFLSKIEVMQFGGFGLAGCATFKLYVMTPRCLHGQAPRYLADHLIPAFEVCVPPTDTGSLCLTVDSTRTVVGLFRSLVRRSGTHCQMNSDIRRVMLTAANSSLKQSY